MQGPMLLPPARTRAQLAPTTPTRAYQLLAGRGAEVWVAHQHVVQHHVTECLTVIPQQGHLQQDRAS